MNMTDYLDCVEEDTGTRPATCWAICDCCHGEGTLGGWPGAFTESDRAEWSDEDYEDYRTTRRECEECGGSGKVRELADDEYAEGWHEWLAEEAADRATMRAESGWAW